MRPTNRVEQILMRSGGWNVPERKPVDPCAVLLLKALLTTLAITLEITTTPHPATAATRITLGNTCKLSTNWTIRASATYYNTHNTPSRGTLAYTVLVSPGPLHVAPGETSWATYLPNGAATPEDRNNFNYTLDNNAPLYTYRANANVPNTARVDINALGGNGACRTTIHSKN